MHTNELTVNSTSSSSTPSEAKYYADESESEKSPVCRKITSQPAAKNTKKLRKRDLTRSSIPVVAEQKVKRVPPIKPKSDDHAYLADVESIGSGPLKTSTELDKWAAIYRMLKEDLREEFVDKKEIKPAAPAAIVMQPKSILKKPSASWRQVQSLESTAKPAPVRLKTSLTPIRPLPQHSAQARMLENLPNELLINLKQSQGLKSKPGSLKSEQIKLVLARNQELEKNRIHNIESTRRLKETRLAEVKVNKRSEQLERKTKGQFTRQERTEMAKIKRQLLLQQQNKILQMKGII